MKTKGKRNIRKVPEATASVQVASQSVAETLPQQQRPVIVIVGGSRGKAVTENAAAYSAVTPEQMKGYGQSKKTVLRGLAMNLIAGTTLDRAFFDRDNDDLWTRDLRTEKAAFFYLVEKSNRGEIAMAWETTLAGRKRYDAPTLQALSKAVRRFKLLGEGSEIVSPMERFARKIIAALVAEQVSDSERIRQALVLLREKSGETVTEQAGTQVQSVAERKAA